MTDWYRPPHVTQRTGTACSFSNCWATVGAWLARAATNGGSSPTPEEFKRLAGGGSGRPAPDGCGTGFEVDVVKGLRILGIDSRIIKVMPKDVMKIMSVERRAVFGLAVDYSLWPVEKDCMNGIAGADVNHMVGFIGGTPFDDVMNPLCSAYQAVAASKVTEAATQFATEHGRDTIWLIRVARPIPASSTGDKARILELEGMVAERDDAIAEAQAFATRLGEILAPFKKGA